MVRIIADTLSCLEQEFADKYQIPVISQVINFGEESYYEGKEISTEEFLERLKASKVLPKTAAPPPELFAKEFARLGADGEPILCILPTAELSGTVRSAEVAKQDFPDADIRIIDTRSIGSALGTFVKLAALWAEAGLSADAIQDRIYDLIPRSRIYFLVSTLDYLARGGRIGGASALLGSLLQVKPILTILDGKIEVFEKERTQKKAYQRLLEITTQQLSKNGDGYLTVMHAGVPEQGAELARVLENTLRLPAIHCYNIPPAIVTHAGPGILATAFFA
jgi:DegV family protein with EDD domain